MSILDLGADNIRTEHAIIPMPVTAGSIHKFSNGLWIIIMIPDIIKTVFGNE